MYAIAFDLEQDTLSKTYGSTNYTNAYNDIKKILNSYGFSKNQGTVYFGDIEKVDAINCVLAVQDLTDMYPWFSASIQDIKMFRIEEISDLKKVIYKQLNKRN